MLAPNEVLSSVRDLMSRQIAELIVINSVCVVGPTQQRFNFLLQSFGFRLHPILSTPSAVSRQERRASYVETQLPSTFFRSASRLQVSVASVPASLRAPTMLSQLSAVLSHDACLPRLAFSGFRLKLSGRCCWLEESPSHVSDVSCHALTLRSSHDESGREG